VHRILGVFEQFDVPHEVGPEVAWQIQAEAWVVDGRSELPWVVRRTWRSPGSQRSTEARWALPRLVTDALSRPFALGEHARALQLERGTREGIGEHVVELAGDAAALGDRRRPHLLLARVLKLSHQHLDRAWPSRACRTK